ncbi:MAG: alanine racemase [Candidatus Thorarchaeota archaeon]|nr:MAG: alanine racemase [Candidatus Thorarchaeota archaeon]
MGDNGRQLSMYLSDLVTPATVIDRPRLLRNIERMSVKAALNDVSLRPHIKTHKCLEIVHLQQKYGAKGFTVSTLAEARVLTGNGFEDLILAVPLALGWIPTAVEIASESNLKVLVDSQDVVRALHSACRENDIQLKVMMKVDCGYHRCGVDPESPKSIDIAQEIVDSPYLGFEGILTHAGHSYYTKDSSDIQRVASQEQHVMIDFARRLTNKSSDLTPETVSIGSTPTMMYDAPIKEGITEIRPGSYVFFDYHQLAIGSCKSRDCALTVLSSVLGNYNTHIVVDAGATALSKDRGPVHLYPDCGYGRIFTDYNNGAIAQDTLIEGLSQEHGTVLVGNTSPLRKAQVGHKVRILPNHSCLTANLSDSYYVAEGEEIVDTWLVRSERELTNINDRQSNSETSDSDSAHLSDT